MNNLISSLESLRLRLDKSGVNRTYGLATTMGDDCFYYKKSLDLFERQDLDELKQLLLEVAKEMKKVEPSFLAFFESKGGK
jgi:hypothetical protein